MTPQKPWYKRPIPLVVASLIAVTFGSSLISSPSANTTAPEITNTASAVAAYQQATVAPATQPVQAPTQPTVQPVQPQTTPIQQTTQVQTTNNTQLSNDNTYTNVNGVTVHSPAYTSDNSVPAGASAQCRDGSYSFSTHRSGTCSHHGGVATWY